MFKDAPHIPQTPQNIQDEVLTNNLHQNKDADFIEDVVTRESEEPKLKVMNWNSYFETVFYHPEVFDSPAYERIDIKNNPKLFFITFCDFMEKISSTWGVGQDSLVEEVMHYIDMLGLLDAASVLEVVCKITQLDQLSDNQKVHAKLELTHAFMYDGESYTGQISEYILTKNSSRILELTQLLYQTALSGDGWSQKSVENIKDILGIIMDKTNLPIVKYNTKLYLDRLFGYVADTGWTQSQLTEEEKTFSSAITVLERDVNYNFESVNSTKSKISLPISSDFIGLFNSDYTLRALGPISDVREKIKYSKDNFEEIVKYDIEVEFHPLNYSTFGLSKDNAGLLTFINNPTLKRVIEGDIGFSFSSLSLNTQVNFLKMISEKDMSEYSQLCALLNTYSKVRKDVLVSYLTIKEISNNEDLLLKLSVNKSKETFEEIVERFASIVKTVEKSKLDVQEYFNTSSSLEVEEWNSIVSDIIEKAKKLLIDFQSDTDVTLTHELEKVSNDHYLFLHIFKILKNKKETVVLEDIKSSTFEYTPGSEITEEQKNAMRDIYRRNHDGNKENEDKLLAEFEGRLIDGITKFYVFSWQGTVQSFMAITPKEEGALYCSGFNVAPEARGYKIGEAMLDEAIEKESDSILLADCYTHSPVSGKYIETGWVAVKAQDDNGNMVLDIKRDDKIRDTYIAKSMTRTEISAQTQESVPSGMRIQRATEQKLLPFELLNQDYVLTRMFKDGEEMVGVFEKAE
jgi:GNAT superfamily N-acetyltransferase